MSNDAKIIPFPAPGDRTVRLDLDAMRFVQSRLTLDDFGRISVQIARAAAAKRPSELQRLLLSIVQHREADDGTV
jgi:hypothetical protein